MPTLVTTAEAATFLTLSPRTLENWRARQKGEGPPFKKLGTAVRYDVAALEQWLKDSEQTGQP
ncbi:MAG TPA: helix-turn-helix domain-containing protein [Arthrobacter sp.]